MQHYHAVVWLDHTQARIFFFDRNSVEEIDIGTRTANHHIHHKKGSIAGKRQPEDQHFMHEVIEALQPAKEWLVMGPGTAKLPRPKRRGVDRTAAQRRTAFLPGEVSPHVRKDDAREGAARWQQRS